MTESRQFRLRRIVLFSLVASWTYLLLPAWIQAQSSGPSVDECSSEVVDTSYDVEETVCLYGDASGVTASAEVDNNDTTGYVAGDDADVDVYQGSTFLYETGDTQSSGTAEADYEFTPVINAVYTANSFYGECNDYTYSFDYTNCTWSGDSNGPSTQVQVTPSVSLTTSSPSVATGSSVTFTASVTGGLTGTITFYDGTATVGTGTINGSDATFTTGSLTVGFHNITAYWPGNSTYGPLTSSVIVQTVFQPGPMQLPAAGIITTVAGNGVESYSGDGSYAMAAELIQPTAVAVDSEGDLYVADSNLRIREVNASTGVITTVAGNGTAGYSGDGGAATNAELSGVYGIALDASGNIYIADSGNQRIRKVTVSTGIISTVAGNGVVGYSGDGGAATSAELRYPTAVALDAAGDIYIADSNNNRIRKVSASTGVITTVAGNGTGGFSGDGGAATSAEINIGYAAEGGGTIAVDSAGNIYIADFFNHRIRKVNLSSGIITTVAGNGTFGYSGDDGLAINAEISYPTGVAIDSTNNVYISDFNNARIRKVSSSGTISTVAGNGSSGYAGDGGPATSAELYLPADVTVDVSGNLYIADKANNRIRAVGSATAKANPTVSLSATLTSIPSLCSGAVSQFTATINGGSNPTGTVAFLVDGITFGSITLSGNTASYNGSNECWQVGTHTVTATYSGDGANNEATSGGVVMTVTVGTPTISAWPTASAISYGQTLASSTLSGGTASVGGSFAWTSPSTTPPVGTTVESVTFTPSDTTDYAAVTGSANVTVNQGAPTISLTTSQTSSPYGELVSFTATISGGLTGTVTFYDGDSAIGTGTINGTTATFTTSTLTSGTHNISATWSGDAPYSPVTSNSITQTVTGNLTTCW